jgi:hypothetical protein
MGTRGLTVVVSNNNTKVAQYGQWDHYPSGQGVTALKILTEIMGKGMIDTFKEKVNNLKWLTQDQIDELNKEKDPYEKHPYLKRDWGCQILEAVMWNKLTVEKSFVSDETKYEFEILGLLNQEKFAGESLFCEWAYVVDLDKMTFEVYRGFNKEILGEDERFAKVKMTDESEYKPVRHVKTYDLNNLPSEDEFLKELEPRDEDQTIV